MKTAYYPLNNNTNKYVKIIVDAISASGIEIDRVDINDNNFDFELINLNWYESIFEKNYISVIKEYYAKLRYIKALKKNNIKIIWTIHNKIPHDNRNVAFSKKIMKLLLREADGIIVHCKETVEVLKEIDSEYNFENKVFHIPHPTYSNAYKESNLNFRESLGLKDELVYLFIGQIRPYKNVEIIIEAAKEIKDARVKFVIAGNVSSRIYKRKLLNSIKNSNNIIPIFKFIEDDDIASLIKASDVVTLPYNIESSLNSGVAILAFSNSKTIVCPNIGTLKDFEDKSLFYSYTYSSEKEHKEILIKKVKEVYKDYNLNEKSLKEKGKKLKDIVDYEYSFEKTRKKYEVVYNKVLKNKE